MHFCSDACAITTCTLQKVLTVPTELNIKITQNTIITIFEKAITVKALDFENIA